MRIGFYPRKANNWRLSLLKEGTEFDLVKRDEQGHIMNSVVHLLTRPMRPWHWISSDIPWRGFEEASTYLESERCSFKEAAIRSRKAPDWPYRSHYHPFQIAEATYRRWWPLQNVNMRRMTYPCRSWVEACLVVVYKQLEMAFERLCKIIEGWLFQNNTLSLTYTGVTIAVVDNRTWMENQGDWASTKLGLDKPEKGLTTMFQGRSWTILPKKVKGELMHWFSL